MRIAVSIWEDKISPVLDTASKLLIIEEENQKKTSCFEVYLLEQDIQQRCSFIRGLDLDVLICGAVSRQLDGMLLASGIKVISSISGLAEDVLEDYLQGIPLHSRFFMPGSKNNHLDQTFMQHKQDSDQILVNEKGKTILKGGKNSRRKKSKNSQPKKYF